MRQISNERAERYFQDCGELQEQLVMTLAMRTCVEIIYMNGKDSETFEEFECFIIHIHESDSNVELTEYSQLANVRWARQKDHKTYVCDNKAELNGFLSMLFARDIRACDFDLHNELER